MRRSVWSVLLAMVLVMSMALAAEAGRVRWRVTEFGSGSLAFDGVAVGLGNGDYTFSLTGTADVIAQCENKGGTEADGRNTLSATASDADTETPGENGQAAVHLEVDIDESTLDVFGDAPPSNKDAGCPNGGWNIVGIQVQQWTSAHIAVTDNASNEVVLEQWYNCSGIDDELKCDEA